MKKLLYTLMVGLTIMSCAKDELGESVDTSSINAIVEENVTDKLTGDALIDLAINMANKSIPAKRGNASNSNKGSDYVSMILFASNDVEYATLQDESNDDLCLGDQTHIVVYLNKTADGMDVESSDESILASVTGNFDALFDGLNDSVSSYNSEFDIISSATFNEDNVATF